MRVYVTAGVCACVLALAGAPAMADGVSSDYPDSALNISVSGLLSAGSIVTVTATGTNASTDPSGVPNAEYDVSVFAVDEDALPTPCYQSERAEEMFYDDHSGPSVRNFTHGTYEEPFHQFSMPFSVKFGGPGRWAVCAYTTWEGDDVAWASSTVTIGPRTAGSGTTTAPRLTAAPRITRLRRRLRCSLGRWSGRPTSYAYQWRVLHRSGVAGRARSLAVTGSLRGHLVQCSVTATNAAGSVTGTSPSFRVT